MSQSCVLFFAFLSPCSFAFIACSQSFGGVHRGRHLLHNAIWRIRTCQHTKMQTHAPSIHTNEQHKLPLPPPCGQRRRGRRARPQWPAAVAAAAAARHSRLALDEGLLRRRVAGARGMGKDDLRPCTLMKMSVDYPTATEANARRMQIIPSSVVLVYLLFSQQHNHLARSLLSHTPSTHSMLPSTR